MSMIEKSGLVNIKEFTNGVIAAMWKAEADALGKSIDELDIDKATIEMIKASEKVEEVKAKELDSEKESIGDIKPDIEKVEEVNAKELDSEKESIGDIKPDIEKVEESKKNEVKVEAEENDTRPGDSIPNVHILPTETPKIKIKTVEDKIAMGEREKINPVQSISNAVKRITPEQKVDESLDTFIATLKSANIPFSRIKRTSTGLVEVDLIKTNGTKATISVDIDNKIYNYGPNVFFIGKIKPLEEYNKQAFVCGAEPLNSIINGTAIDNKFYVPSNILILNRMIDLSTLKVKKEEKQNVFSKVSKVFAKMNDEIVKFANGTPYRFAFASCKSKDDFVIVSSNRNRISNLSDDKLKTDKQIWISVKDKEVTIDNKNPRKKDK